MCLLANHSRSNIHWKATFVTSPNLPDSFLVWVTIQSDVSSGFRQRRREVLWESGSLLETCPHLVESIPCEDPTCYLWQIKEDPCIPTSGSCGPGTAIQNVSCVSTQGKVLCPLHPIKPLTLLNKAAFKLPRKEHQHTKFFFFFFFVLR